MCLSVNKKVVFIGDSNTEGFGIGMDASYPSLIAERLKAYATCFNFGVSGTCVIDEKISGITVGMPYIKTHAYSKACAIKGDLYVINLGTNDATDGTSDIPGEDIDPYGNLIALKHRFKTHYAKIIQGIRDVNPEAKFLLCIPIPIRKSIWVKHKEAYMQMLIPYILEVAAVFGIQTIDLHSPFLNDKNSEANYLEDGLHLSVQGARAIADLITPKVVHLLS